MKTERYQAYLQKQRKEMELYKWNKGIELGKDPGQEAVHDWIIKYSKKYRKEFALCDIKNALSELKEIRANLQSHLGEVTTLTKIVNECEEKILDALELLESEPDLS